MANFYISDTHFGHYNLMVHSRTMFKTVEEMDTTIIKNWNQTVKAKDHVYILGDFCWLTANETYKILKKLNGKKHLIVGNHDKQIIRNPECLKMFESIDVIKTISDQGKRIVLCHYPLAEWDGYFRGSYHFFGHIHANKNESYIYMKNVERAYNVGADVLNFTPRKFEDVVKLNNEMWKKESE